MKNVVISLFGSSIMEGSLGVEHAAERYYMIVQLKLSERFPDVCFAFVNGAVGGQSTRELMQIFDENVLKYSPDYCIVMFGANNNDLVHPERVLKEGELEQLMQEFQNRLPEHSQRVGVVLNPVINERHWVQNHPAFREMLKQFGGLNQILEPEREMVRKFYRENLYPVIDLAGLMAADPERYICGDGIHLSKEGHKLFAGALFETLEELLIRSGYDPRRD